MSELGKKREYYECRRPLKRTIRLKKRDYRRAEIEDLTTGNSWDRVWEAIGEWRVRRGDSALKTRNGREIGAVDEWDKGLIGEYHPDLSLDEKEEWESYQRTRMKGRVNVKFDVGLREEEVEEVIARLKKKKACGDDRIPNESTKHVWSAWKEGMMKVYGACMEMGIFPRVWKEARIRWLPKKGGGVQVHQPATNAWQAT